MIDLERFQVGTDQEETIPRMIIVLNNEEMGTLLLVKAEKMEILISMMDELIIDRLKQDGNENIMMQ